MSDQPTGLQVENVVASTEIDQELDLGALAGDLEQAQYDPLEFPGLVYRIQQPKVSMLVFSSGKITATGAQSRDEIGEALTVLYRDLSGLGLDVPETPDFTVQNVVSSGSLGQELNLNAIAIGLGLETVEYDPEQFPGLIYRVDDPGVVVLLFASGKLVVTGAQSKPEAEQGLEVVRNQIDELGLLD